MIVIAKDSKGNEVARVDTTTAALLPGVAAVAARMHANRNQKVAIRTATGSRITTRGAVRRLYARMTHRDLGAVLLRQLGWTWPVHLRNTTTI